MMDVIYPPHEVVFGINNDTASFFHQTVEC
jgi:hypothetical protein